MYKLQPTTIIFLVVCFSLVTFGVGINPLHSLYNLEDLNITSRRSTVMSFIYHLFKPINLAATLDLNNIPELLATQNCLVLADNFANVNIKPPKHPLFLRNYATTF